MNRDTYRQYATRTDMKKCGSLTVCLAFFLLLLPSLTQAGAVVYNKYNIHTYNNGRDFRASYANWTDPGSGHGIVPPNTPMIIENWRSGFIIKTQKAPKQTIYFLYDKGRMTMKMADYIRTITSPSPVSMEKLTPLDLEGVKEGRAIVGMTKEGVLTALGYPAQHRTPSLQAREWTYWKNRFTTLVVFFDSRGIVTDIKE